MPEVRPLAGTVAGRRAAGNGERGEVDVAGVGIGPFNLSLAALLQPVRTLTTRFLEARDSFDWHPGLLFDHATLQSPYLKDLVTLVDPTNPLSFLNYLVSEKRLYRFIVADYANVPRKEYNRYFQWACSRLPSLRFGVRVRSLDFRDGAFVLETTSGPVRSRSVVLGVGPERNVPDAAVPFLGERVFHGSEFLSRGVPTRGKRVVIVGGGQTGAEIFYHLLQPGGQAPEHVTWVTRRHNFVPFDESPFANELYVPAYARAFYGLPAADRRRLLDKQKYSSDAIIEPLLLQIYRRLYELDYLSDDAMGYRLLVDRELEAMDADGDGYAVVTRGPGAREVNRADVVVLATGFKFAVPSLLHPILDRIHLESDGRFVMREDFSVSWDGPETNRIYAHNAGLHSHGWLDPNFAGMAWRSGVMVNSLAGEPVYDLDESSAAVDWAGDMPGDVLATAARAPGDPGAA